MSTISFTKVKLPYGWLSNMSPHPLEYKGVTYRTAEALFQALRFDDESLRELIRAEKSPMAAKFKAKSFIEKAVIEPRSDEDLDNMRFVIRLKMAQHLDLAKGLVGTRDSEIVEDCTKRQGGSGLFWGAALQEDGSWEGENWLGKLYMELRDEIIDAAVVKSINHLHDVVSNKHHVGRGSIIGELSSLSVFSSCTHADVVRCLDTSLERLIESGVVKVVEIPYFDSWGDDLMNSYKVVSVLDQLANTSD